MWYDFQPLFPLYDLILVAAVACAVNIWETAKAFPSPPARREYATMTITAHINLRKHTCIITTEEK